MLQRKVLFWGIGVAFAAIGLSFLDAILPKSIVVVGVFVLIASSFFCNCLFYCKAT